MLFSILQALTLPVHPLVSWGKKKLLNCGGTILALCVTTKQHGQGLLDKRRAVMQGRLELDCIPGGVVSGLQRGAVVGDPDAPGGTGPRQCAGESHGI